MKLFYLLRTLRRSGKLERILRERLPEPLHLNLLSAVVALFGSFRAKVEFDLVVRQQFAFSILKAADIARSEGITSLTVIEFGVAAGAGLQNICEICADVTKATGVQFSIVGFDTGSGMPPPRDYRDHPELFAEGQFPMIDQARLIASLPDNARLILGPISEMLPAFEATVTSASPIGFVSIDVDYYWSAKECLDALRGPAKNYLPTTIVYLDDIGLQSANPWVGELLAVNEFNDENRMRKIYPYTQLRTQRIFKGTRWIDHIFVLHVLDHPRRSVGSGGRGTWVLSNPYLGTDEIV